MGIETFDQDRQDHMQITHKPLMGDIEYGCVAIGIDGHDAIGTVHPGRKMHRTGYATGNDQFRFDRET